jgi:hypothetical protein
LSYTPTISLNVSKLELVIGERTTVVATTHPAGMAVTWEVGDSNIIGIDSGGNVIALRAGQTTLYAKVTDTDGDEYTAQCSVYVRIVDGVYRVTNLYSVNCLHVAGMNILPGTTVTQSDQLTIPTQSNDDISALAQLWRFAYIGNGYYSIRPYYKTDMGLFRGTSSVFLNTLGTSNTSDAVPLEAKWTLAWGTSGYMIKGRGLSIFTLQSEKISSGTSVFVAPSTGDFECQWRLTRVISLPSGVALYKRSNGSPLMNGTRAIAVGETKTLSELNITAVAYSPNFASQNITVSVANYATATGISITGTATGTTTVTVSCTGNSDSLTASFALNVVPLKPGMYILQNRQNKMVVDIEGPNMTSGTEIHQWDVHGGDSQRWILSYTDEGYYTICSKNSTNAFYLGVENNSQETDANIVLRIGSPNSGMLWKIVPTSEGAFRLYPKLAESQTTPRALVATTSDDSNGERLAYGNYVVNDSFRDEWHFCEPKDYSLVYIGYEVGDSAMPPIVTAVRDKLRNVAEMDGYEHTSLTKHEVLVHLSSVSVFSCITHGAQTQILATDGTISVDDIDYLSDSAFDELKFVYFGACETGKGKGAEVNLVNTVYNKGADAVLGFTINVLVDETNAWTEAFMLALAEGTTIATALLEADAHLSEDENMEQPQLTTGPDNRYLLGSDQLIPCE